MVELIYEIIPGVTARERPADPTHPFTVDATYDADVPLGWSTGGRGPGASGGPGWTEDYRGGASTLGGWGPWPVPSGAQHLAFWLHDALSFTCKGVLRVDLGGRAAEWRDSIETGAIG